MILDKIIINNHCDKKNWKMKDSFLKITNNND